MPHPRSNLLLTLLTVVAGFAIVAGTAAQDGTETSCVACHSDADLFEEEAVAIVSAFATDVHAEVGLSCHDCHGGNPDADPEDMFAAKDESLPTNPFSGAPERSDGPAFCGRCHSDANIMRRYRPDAVTDQERQYWTSLHGQALARGDTKVATCADCHGVHGIRRVGDPDSRVYPTNVFETCGTCHGDAEHMAGYMTPDGRTVPTNQSTGWRLSVHAEAMFDKGDLSAPTCNDCHGSHGATPPGLASIALVCGQCHGREAELFRGSPKHRGFETHTELLADAGDDGCAACHEAPDPAASWTASHVLVECTTCHDQHAIMRPTLALLSPLPEAPCVFCHESATAEGAEMLAADVTQSNYERTKEGLLVQAADLGLEGDARFDWLVDSALTLPFHTQLAGSPTARPPLRPEFERLFTKFRIGKTTYELEDPETGEQLVVKVRRCTDCHAAEPDLADEPVGLRTAEALLQRTHELSARTATAERILLRARRGGVETREALAELDQAVDASIQLEALVHTFSADDDGVFVEAHEKGMEHASAALEEAEQALAELGFRRRGLVLALAVILVLLAALGLKIRQLES